METQTQIPGVLTSDDHRSPNVHEAETWDQPTPSPAKEGPISQPEHGQDNITLEADTVMQFREVLPGIKRLSVPQAHLCRHPSILRLHSQPY